MKIEAIKMNEILSDDNDIYQTVMIVSNRARQVIDKRFLEQINLDEIEDTDELIQFSAQGSSDSDGDSINFIWYSSLDGEILRTSAIMGEAILSQGTHIITLRVTDSQGEYTEQSIQISVSLSAESFDSDDSTLSSLSFLVTTLLVVTISQIKRKY